MTRRAANRRSFIILLALVAILWGYAYLHARYLILGVSGNSMLPTVQNNDSVLVDTDAYSHRAPGRGDIIAFYGKDDQGNQVTYLKRIVATAHEQVTLHGDQVSINGTVLDEPYLFLGPAELTGTSKEYTVGSNQYFVLGDNRSFSKDSREFGPITGKDIRGKVVAHW